ncbi:Gfo/Idh/MocA family protein [Leucobacter tenebrionis]|uniref:Gfo/Idh/MocA family protein n=1 Tax=Leucobacter tenebrionis TaxID=2873270 RepID=UPI001CA784B6|nr:Gfo/Idh/MocA family oxidoreductase [Leucobacter tenebrionis]QZY50791.1 Gfo/Idh/MocA family oxidoreductase [Leucobacter tenebrionis]
MRIGLVGYGAGGRLFHLPYIQAATEWEIVGVVTRSPERRAALAAEAPELPTFDSLDELIDTGLDAVVITTPPSTRRELVLRALERGVHVVADKPFAPDQQVARELAEAAETAGKILTVFQNRRWDTDLITLRNVLETGELGTPWRANFVLDQNDPGTLEAGPGDGLLRDLGAHVVDQVIQLFGPVARVDGHLDWLDADAGRIDVGFALGLHHESGVYSAVSASKLGHRAERGMIVYGSEGSYASRMHDVQFDQLLAGERPATAEQWGVEKEERWGVLSTASGQRRVPSAAGDYSDFYRELHAAIADGAPLPVKLDEALHTIAVLDAARESDARGRSIDLP